MSKSSINNELIIYQTKSGALELRADVSNKTIWLTQQQVGDLFDVQKAAISKHVHNIFDTNELEKSSTVSKMETVQSEGGREVKRMVEYYNLDLVLSIGYRVNSKKATHFRIWATQTLRKHIINGYTINKARIGKNYEIFFKAVEDVKKILPEYSLSKTDTSNILELISSFASTWLSLDAYDRENFPTKGLTKEAVSFTISELNEALSVFKSNLMAKGEATDIFGVERHGNGLQGAVGNIFATFGGKDLYSTVEEKAAHLLYFIIKDHPLTDGNKRSGAFSFIWFLNRAGIFDRNRINSVALTAITLLIAESNPKDKERMIGLVLLLLKK